MANMKGKTGDNSTLLQAEQIFINSNPKNANIHCCNCEEIMNRLTNKQPCSLDGYCNQLTNITSTIHYLIYRYKEKITNDNDKYINPTLIVNENIHELSLTKYETYDDHAFFLSDDYNIYIISGEGGIGKSTLLTKVFYSLVDKAFCSQGQIIPFIINCHFFGHNNLSPEEWLYKTINNRFPNLDISEIVANENNKIYFLVDAINSMQYKDKNDFEEKMNLWAQFVKEFCELHPNISFIITSRNLRELDYFETPSLKKIIIKPLELYKAEKFISLFVSDYKTRTELYALIKAHKDMSFLRIPYFLCKIIDYRKGKQQIKNKTEIVLLYTTSLLEKYNRLTVKIKKIKNSFNNIKFWDLNINEVSFFKVIFYCAYLCQEQNKKVLTEKDIHTICEALKITDIDLILDIAINEELMILEGKVYTFSHPILQEFFSAMHIFLELGNDYVSSEILRFSDETMNLEVIPHIYNLVNDKNYFINVLINDNYLKYAAESVVNNGKELKEQVALSIISYLKSNQCDRETRISLGKYLGKIGDTRFIYEKDYIEPLTSFVTGMNNVKVAIFPVTNQEFSMFIKDQGYLSPKYWGDSDESEYINYEAILNNMFAFWKEIRMRFDKDEQSFVKFCKNHSVDVEQCVSLAWFLNMSDDELLEKLKELYKEDSFKQPLLWEDPDYNNPLQPVVGISYFEAQAYCTWLSEKSGKHYRLLTKDEWEYVAKANFQRFSFGETINSENCNTIESNYQMILPVGVIEANRTNDGIYDVNGNIFEWTNTIYKDSSTILSRQMYVKGGSWIQTKERATSNYDGRAKTWCRNLDLGFRMCIDEND